jgi:hypothetical protein
MSASEVPEKRKKKSQASKTYGTDRTADDDALCRFSGIAQVRVLEFERRPDTESTVQSVLP